MRLWHATQRTYIIFLHTLSTISAFNLRCVRKAAPPSIPSSRSIVLAFDAPAFYTPFYTSLLVCINFVPGTCGTPLTSLSPFRALHVQPLETRESCLLFCSLGRSLALLRFVIAVIWPKTRIIKANISGPQKINAPKLRKFILNAYI